MPEALTLLGPRYFLVVGTVLMGLALVGARIGWRAHKRHVKAESKHDWGVHVASTSGVVLITSALILLVGMFPYVPKYWFNYRLEGTITEIDTSWSYQMGALIQAPVAVIDSMEAPIVIDDPRAVKLEGKEVALRCVIHWNQLAMDTYTCKVAEVK